jgi:membrane fusion protein, multidrug efflux system|tara:strand:- start:3919 stop:4233 length:315 start_codon:yes stop_codon:yes gene_type:complete
VRAKIYAGKIPNGITIPQQAVTLTGEGGSVYLIDKEGQALVRPIKLGNMVDGEWIVESGLKPGDTVIVSNLQKIRPGVPVKISNTPTGRRPAPAPSTAASGKGR